MKKIIARFLWWILEKYFYNEFVEIQEADGIKRASEVDDTDILVYDPKEWVEKFV